jgi:hypothetical protein
LANATPAGVTGRASIPSTANQKGGINESTPLSQRSPKARTELEQLSPGPIVGENDEYQPASYEIVHTAEATATRPERVVTMIRTDR